MNMRTPDNLFMSTRVAKVTQDADLAAADGATAQTPERVLLCSKSRNMCERVRRAIGEGDDVAIELAPVSLLELAEGDLEILNQHDIIVTEIDPADQAEMKALRHVTASAATGTRFLAITPQELTITVARDLMDAGVLEVLPVSALRDPASDAQSPMGAAPQALHNGMVLSIAQSRGGIGATTLAVNLAAMLSQPQSKRDKTPAAKVALLDLDIQNGDASASIDIEDNGALIELLKERSTPDAAFVRRAMVSYKDQFDVLPTPEEFAPFDAFTHDAIKQLIIELRHAYDYVIIGLPRAMVSWLAPVLALSDQMLLVTDTSVPGVRQSRRLIDFYTEDNIGLPVDIVVSREKKPMSMPKALKEAAKFLEKPFDIWIPNDARTAQKAVERGIPMAEAAKRSASVKSLRQIVNKMTQIKDSEKRREA